MHTGTALSLLSFFYRLFSLFVFATFLNIPTPAHPSLHLHCPHLCLHRFFFILLLLKCKTALNLKRCFFLLLLLLPCGLRGKIWSSGTEVHVGLQLLIKNQHWPVCHEVRNLSGLLCGRCTDEDILHCHLWHRHTHTHTRKRVKKKDWRVALSQLHFLKVDAAYFQLRLSNKDQMSSNNSLAIVQESYNQIRLF